MDSLIQLAMQIIFCLLIAALLGAIIGYLLGKMRKCNHDDDTLNLNNDPKTLNNYDDNRLTNATVSGVSAVTSNLGDAIDNDAMTTNIKDIDHTTPSIGQEIGVRPSFSKLPDNGEVDDLKEISGIGLKIEEILNSLGIYYFKQIAEWTSDNVDWIENYLSLKRRVKKEDWIGQAKLLSAGGHTEFSKKVRDGENPNYN